MEKILSACGNNCSFCPRFLPKTDSELKQTAELWMKIGYRDHVVTNKEISCTGCNPENWCRYKIVNCVTEKEVRNCGECLNYPCENIISCFETTNSFAPDCKRVCSNEEYEMLRKAFFCKEKNLNEVKSKT